MRWSEQGTVDNQRYVVVPRTLVFLTDEDDVLLLRGAAHKKLWAGKLNGVGGHVNPGEDILAGARREVQEETGLTISHLVLRAVVHISGRDAHPGVALFVFVGRTSSRDVCASQEGELAWYAIKDLPQDDLVDDLRLLLPRVLALPASEGFIYGHYIPQPSGEMVFHFDSA